ncbi:MAG: hypothetical protein ACI8ZF_001025 [Candidatus Midichloriaceae bacterium]|jgi:hypothetical protein
MSSEITVTKPVDSNKSTLSAENKNTEKSVENQENVFLQIFDELLSNNLEAECEVGQLCDGIDISQNGMNKIDTAELDGVNIGEFDKINIAEFDGINISELNVNKIDNLENTNVEADILSLPIPTVQFAIKDPKLEAINKSITGEMEYNLASQEFEQEAVRMNFNFTEDSDYKQNNLESSFPTNLAVDTSNLKNSTVILQTSETKDLSTVDYQKSHAMYYEQQKVTSEAKLDFSLEKIETKIVTQINFAVSKAENSGNKRISVQLAPKELGRIEIHIEIINNERTVTINADKISTYEILRRNAAEFSQNLVFDKSDEQMNTNLQFEYKDLSNWNESKDQDFEDKQNTVLLLDKSPAMLNAIIPNTVILRGVDKLVDYWV